MNGIKHKPLPKTSNRKQAEMYLNKTTYSKKKLSNKGSVSRIDTLNKTEVFEGDNLQQMADFNDLKIEAMMSQLDVMCQDIENLKKAGLKIRDENKGLSKNIRILTKGNMKNMDVRNLIFLKNFG